MSELQISLTPASIERSLAMLAKRGSGIGIRIKLVPSGCAGFAYIVDYADEVQDTDAVKSFGELKVVIEKKHLDHFKGMTVDYVKHNLLNSGFEFQNPNVKDACGCGESVTF